MKIIGDVLEDVDVLVDTNFFNELSETKSLLFLKVIKHQNAVEMKPSREHGGL